MNVTIDNNDGTIKYKEKKSWQFVAERSVGHLNDSVTHLNIPLLVRPFSHFANAHGADLQTHDLLAACQKSRR